MDKTRLEHHETPNSANQTKLEEWDPTWIEKAFTAWMRCPVDNCKQQVAVVGVGGVDPAFDEDGQSWEEYFAPRYIFPMPDIIAIPRPCPDEVAVELRASFRLFFADGPACASKIRLSLECLLDWLGIRRRKRVPGQIQEITLHKRIELLRPAQPELADQLMAIKWLGNTGAHQSSAKREDLLDAYEILEHVLDEVVNQRRKKVKEIAKRLTQTHKRKPKR